MRKLWLSGRAGILALLDEPERLAERQETAWRRHNVDRRRLVRELNKMLKQPSRRGEV
jgi:hypothetical protein